MRNNFKVQRHAERIKLRIARLTTDWKRTSAKAYLKYIRNDCKAPLTTFPDPQNNNKLTCDSKRIEELFVEAWKGVYNRAEEELPPSWDDLLDKYGEHIGKLGHISEV